MALTRPAGRPLDGVALEEALLGAVRTAGPAGRGFRGTVSLNLTDADPWSLRVQGGRVWISPGLDPRPDTTIVTESRTLAEVMEGTRSGVEAFLEGDLRVRGNLALSLRLNGLFGDGDRPVRFPRARVAMAGHLRTFYLEGGRGQPVVLLHGLGATNASFLPTLWDLARDHLVVAPDMPGFGDTSKPVRRYNAEFFSRWLEAFLDRLGLDRVDLVGNSMGGRVAIELALRHPDRVGRVVLLTPSPAFIRRRQFVQVVRLLRPEMALVPLPMRHAMVIRAIRRMFARPERLPDPWYEAAADEFVRVFGTARGRIAFFSAAREIYLEEPYGDSGFWDRLSGLMTPSLFVWGEQDRLVPAKFARHVERALPAATSVVMEDCGHVPQYEHPDRTHELIREFLS